MRRLAVASLYCKSRISSIRFSYKNKYIKKKSFIISLFLILFPRIGLKVNRILGLVFFPLGSRFVPPGKRESFSTVFSDTMLSNFSLQAEVLLLYFPREPYIFLGYSIH